MTRRTLASRIAALYSRKLLPESWVVNPLSLISHSSLVSRGQSRRAATLLFSSPPPSALFPFSFFFFSTSFLTILVLGPVDYLYAPGTCLPASASRLAQLVEHQPNRTRAPDRASLGRPNLGISICPSKSPFWREFGYFFLFLLLLFLFSPLFLFHRLLSFAV